MKTRIRIHDDGAREIIRLLSPEDLEQYNRDDPLLYEKSIVWLEDAETVPFVRVKMVRAARSRRGPISFGDEVRVLGYSKLTPNAPRCQQTNGYIRRVFYLNQDDLTEAGQMPAKCYDPATIMPGVKGRPIRSPEAAL